MLDERTSYAGSFQQLADARRALKVVIPIDKHPCLDADQRLELRKIKSLAIQIIGAAVEELVATLDTLDGDPDIEPNGDELDATNAEDDFLGEGAGLDGPGCSISDAGEYARPEDIRQREFKRSLPNEDAEEDDEDRGEFEDEPLFDPAKCRQLSVLYGDGPGGGELLDSDRDGGDV
jgi:hypothetical protein